jgi:phosphoglycolate phosphatase
VTCCLPWAARFVWTRGHGWPAPARVVASLCRVDDLESTQPYAPGKGHIQLASGHDLLGRLTTTLCCSTSTAFSLTRACHSRAASTALTSHGLAARPEHELHQYLGPPLHRTFRALVGEESLVQPCVDSYRARYRELAARDTAVFPGIRAILDKLAEHLPLVVATSKPRALAEPLLDALNLRGFFAAVVGPELDSENEHKAVTVGRAMRALPPDTRPVMVGDRKHDIAAAHEHDLHAIGVLWGIGSELELLTAGPTHSPTPPPSSQPSSPRRAECHRHCRHCPSRSRTSTAYITTTEPRATLVPPQRGRHLPTVGSDPNATGALRARPVGPRSRVARTCSVGAMLYRLVPSVVWIGMQTGVEFFHARGVRVAAAHRSEDRRGVDCVMAPRSA